MQNQETHTNLKRDAGPESQMYYWTFDTK